MRQQTQVPKANQMVGKGRRRTFSDLPAVQYQKDF